MKVLLVEPKPSRSWGANNQYVGLLRIGHWLEETGHEIRYSTYPNLPKPLLFMPDEIYVTSMFTYDYPAVWQAIEACRTYFPSANIKLGGIYATLCPEHAKQSGADEIVCGRHPQAKFYAPNPNLLPKKPKLAYLFSSYGCNRSCTYCATHLLFGRGIEQTEPEIVLDEIKYLADQGYRRIRFGDDNILYNSESHINLICEGILRNKLKLNLEVSGGMTAKDLTSDTLQLMRKAGFKWFSFAIESISDEVLSRMGRGNHTRCDDLERVVAMCEASGLKRKDIDVYFLIGMPYQTLKDMIDTLTYLLRLGVWAHPQRFTPIPNTVEWKRMGLSGVDYKDLYYKKFVAPNQDAFTGSDLDTIYNIALNFNYGGRWSGGRNWLVEDNVVSDMFRQYLLD